MEKTGQKRNLLDKLKEYTNISGIASEKLFNPEFQRVMESLRANDDAIRAIASGQNIGEANPGDDPISLKDLLKSAKSNLNRREYMSTVSDLGRFHKKVFDITQLISEINVDVDQIHHDFLFKDLDEDKKKYLQQLKSRLAGGNYKYLVKEAGIMDFLANVGTQRGRALAAWEKRYPKQVGKLKKDTASLLQKSESLLSTILSSLKEMSNARASRHVDNYMKSAQKIVKMYQAYDKIFREFYVSNVKNFLEKQELLAPAEEVKDVKELEKQEIPVEKSEETQLTPKYPTTYKPVYPSEMESAAPLALLNKTHQFVEEADPSTIPATPPVHKSEEVEDEEEEFPSDLLARELMEKVKNPGQIGSPKMPGKMLYLEDEEEPRDTEIDLPHDTEKDETKNTHDTELNLSLKTVPGLGKKPAHQKFIDTLLILSGEDINLLRSQIVRYAKSIQSEDPSISIELFKIAKNIG